jgi:hypothetical protein
MLSTDRVLVTMADVGAARIIYFASPLRSMHVFSRYVRPSCNHEVRRLKQPLPDWLRSGLQADIMAEGS